MDFRPETSELKKAEGSHLAATANVPPSPPTLAPLSSQIEDQATSSAPKQTWFLGEEKPQLGSISDASSRSQARVLPSTETGRTQKLKGSGQVKMASSASGASSPSRPQQLFFDESYPSASQIHSAKTVKKASELDFINARIESQAQRDLLANLGTKWDPMGLARRSHGASDDSFTHSNSSHAPEAPLIAPPGPPPPPPPLSLPGDTHDNQFGADYHVIPLVSPTSGSVGGGGGPGAGRDTSGFACFSDAPQRQQQLLRPASTHQCYDLDQISTITMNDSHRNGSKGGAGGAGSSSSDRQLRHHTDQLETKRKRSVDHRRLSNVKVVASKRPASGGGGGGGGANGKSYQKFGCFKVSDTMLDEIVAYRRSLVLLTLAFVYTLFVFGAIVFKPKPAAPEQDYSASLPSSQDTGEEWTQEQIAGWHKQRRLILSEEFLEKTKQPANIRVRDCKSYPSYNFDFQNDWPVSSDSAPLVVSSAVMLDAHGHDDHKLAGISPSLSNSIGHSNSSELANSTNTKATPALLTTSLTNETSTKRPTTTTTTTTTARPKRKFAALNGCMFRRDTTSDSLGDLCCCSGVPKYVIAPSSTKSPQQLSVHHHQAGNRTTASTLAPEGVGVTPRPWTNATRGGGGSGKSRGSNRTVSTTTSRPQSTTTTTTVRPKRRKYVRPHMMCFASASGNLFNSHRLVAPLVSEYNLKNANIKDKGKCIPCSCCHEHDPEMVNKLLANVPLYESSAKKLAQEAAAAALPLTTIDGPAPSGLWISVREKLVDSMRSLDKFLFHLYDLVDLATFTLRYGTYPTDNLVTGHSDGFALNAAPFRAWPSMESSPAPLASSLVKFIRPGVKVQAAKELDSKLIKPLANLLYIDADAYDDFTTTSTTTTSTTTSTTTTTTTTTTSSTTVRPGRRRNKKGKRRRKGPRGRRLRKMKLASSSTTTLHPSADQTTTSEHLEEHSTSEPILTSTPSPVITGDKVTKDQKSTMAPSIRTNSSRGSSSTTKSPTVIINVYAAGQNVADTSKRPKSASTGQAEAGKINGSTSGHSSTSTTSTISPSRPPSITLVTGQDGKIGVSSTGGSGTDKMNGAPSTTNIKLHIELAQTGSNSTSPKASTTIVSNNSTSSTSTVSTTNTTVALQNEKPESGRRLMLVWADNVHSNGTSRPIIAAGPGLPVVQAAMAPAALPTVSAPVASLLVPPVVRQPTVGAAKQEQEQVQGQEQQPQLVLPLAVPPSQRQPAAPIQIEILNATRATTASMQLPVFIGNTSTAAGSSSISAIPTSGIESEAKTQG